MAFVGNGIAEVIFVDACDSITYFGDNTYVLMVTGGGQMGVFYAVSIFPWVLLSFFRFMRATKDYLRSTLVLGVVFGIQVSLDPRIAYLSAISMVVLYFLKGVEG